MCLLFEVEPVRLWTEIPYSWNYDAMNSAAPGTGWRSLNRIPIPTTFTSRRFKHREHMAPGYFEALLPLGPI